MKQLPLCSIVVLLLGAFCTSKPKLSPKDTVQNWQSYIDKNQFDLARDLSTGEALDYINELAGYSTDSDTLAWENNVLLDLQCKIIGDSAICTYNFEDELGQPAPGKLALRRMDGYWFVSRTNFDDATPADTLRAGEEELLFPVDSLEDEE
jgi:hypothetical protein